MSSELVKAAWMGAPPGSEDDPAYKYLPREDRGVIRALRTWEGHVDFDDLKVRQTPTPTMAVNVAAGRAIIDGDQDPSAQGSYVIEPPDEITLDLDPSDGVNPRIDLVGVQIWDDDFDGSGLYDWARVVIPGDPATPPSVPDEPGTAGFLPLAQVLVRAGVGSVTVNEITDVRNRTGHKPFQCELVELFSQTTLPAKGEQAILFDTVQQDPSGMWTGSPYYVVTVPVSGNYQITGVVTRQNDSAGSWLGADIRVIRGVAGSDWTSFNYQEGPTRSGSPGRREVTWSGFLQQWSQIQLLAYSDQDFNNVTDHTGVVPFLVVTLTD